MKQLVEEYNKKFANHDITPRKEIIAEIKKLLLTVVNDDFPYLSINFQYREIEDDLNERIKRIV